jgi:glutathione S-transferase
MKLYYSKGACSLAPHIVLNELNMVFQTEVVDLAAKTSASGDFRTINAKGSVPALKMENGEILTEGAVIMQYLADQKPEMNLMPKLGTTERYRAQEWLNFIASEIHKGFSPLWAADRAFTATAAVEVKNVNKARLAEKFNFLSEELGNNDYLMGKNFTVADAYLFTCLSWSRFVGVDLTTWPSLTKYVERVGSRPAVIKTMKEEGLL